MTHRSPRAACLILGLVGLLAAQAAPPATTQTEVRYLLGFVEGSGCEFYRNGSWFDSKKSRAHLQSKYDFLAASNQIGTAEDFIDKAATKSSMSGQPYAVRCQDGVIIHSAEWLREALACYRKSGPSCAKVGMHDAPSIDTR
jgi:hypothetical protein